MRGRASARFAALAPAVLLAACAGLPVSPPEIPGAEACRADFLGLDAKVAEHHAANAGAYRIAGFPYLRSDRFLASYRGEVPDGAKFDAWVERLRQRDLTARVPELKAAGWAEPDEELRHLERCGRDWAARDLTDPARRAALRGAAAVPDDYSTAQRAIGLYPLIVPFLNLGMSNFDEDVREDYAKPYAQLDAAGPLVLWSPADADADADARAKDLPVAKWLSQPDALGIPRLQADQWVALGRLHLPHWELETAGEFDKPGALTPAFDAAQPVTYFTPAYTRFGGRVLVQLIYTVWFAERPASGLINPYGGALDGIVWRVTLDEQGQPLLYDAIHPCGCYHYYFLAPGVAGGAGQPLTRKPQGGFWDEPILFPQDAPAEPFAVRLASGTHFVRRLVPLADSRAVEKKIYAMRYYAELLSLPDGAGGVRSLFDEDGIVPGTERRERLWLWPAGIQSAGAMRQLGRHATSFVGRTHFDDPALLDRLFEK